MTAHANKTVIIYFMINLVINPTNNNICCMHFSKAFTLALCVPNIGILRPLTSKLLCLTYSVHLQKVI